MKKHLLFSLAGLLPLLLSAQITFQVTAIPANTPSSAKLYLVGNFNNWNPGDSNYKMAKIGAGKYSITINPQPGRLEYKFTRSSWNTVEGNASGGFRPNRILDYDGQPQTVQVQIPGWQDRDTGGGGTAAPNVYILDDDFYIPQLQRTRRIWVYLPPDYALTSKRYPVLYLHDGQNLFDAETSSFGEWGIDESLNKLFNQGDYGCIAIGIDNGGAKRLDELSPWVNEKYGGGEGAQYLAFIMQTLKPYIDSTFRTLPGPQTTGIMGSSMGGLLSMYAFAEHPEVFGVAGVFSPAFWFAGAAPAQNAAAHPKQREARVYLLAGGAEPDYVETDIIEVGNALLSAGFIPQDIYFAVPADGQHSEWFWRREFPKAYQWLLAGAALKTRKQKTVDFGLEINPGATGKPAQITSVKPKERIQLKIVGTHGRVWKKGRQRGGALQTENLPKGAYAVLIKRKGQHWKMGALVKP